MTRLSGHPNVVDLKAVYEEEEYVHLRFEALEYSVGHKGSSSPIKLADFGLATYIKPGQSLNGLVPEVLAGGYNQAADV
ncbi:hypothetical protein ACLB2K_029260 [Fragaria x ananassa]